ncbi:MAG TPA: SHOCT domain-containing protein [Candidatus Marinimicrobia bacterium]|nr:SHOCT domain-containing protein [Candidatus Neomarinimicrobiota bacterium]
MNRKMMVTTIIGLIFTSVLFANPGNRKHKKLHLHHRSNVITTFHVGFGYPSYHNHLWCDPFFRTYPTVVYREAAPNSELEFADTEQILTDIELLKAMMEKGMITEKEFQKAKKKLLSRIGELVPNQNAESNVSVLMQQLVWFRELEQRDILTEDEYNEQKKDILKLI